MKHVRGTGAGSRALFAAMMAALLVAGCGGGEEETAASSTPTAQSAPQLSGTPRALAAVDQQYTFAPVATDADGDTLQFKVTNSPAWLVLNATTGRLRGTPTAADVGTYRGITLEVTDGRSSKTLTPFDIQVVAVGSKAVTLSWLPPTQNEDGSALTDLAGYRIRMGYEPGVYTKRITLTNPGLATYYVEGLVPNKYYFVISAVNRAGLESANSAAAIIEL